MEFGESGLGDPSRQEPDVTPLFSGADMVEKPAAPRTPCLLFCLQQWRECGCVSVSSKQARTSTKQTDLHLPSALLSVLRIRSRVAGRCGHQQRFRRSGPDTAAL